MERTGTPADTCSCCGHSAAFHGATGCAEWRSGKRCLCPAGGYIPVSELGEKGCAVMDLDKLELLTHENLDAITRMAEEAGRESRLSLDMACVAPGVARRLMAQARQTLFLRADLAAMQAAKEKAEAEAKRLRDYIDEAGDGMNLVGLLDLYHDRKMAQEERADHAEAERDEAMALAERRRVERLQALSVQTREGLTASEWVLRTGRAEAERDEARAEVERLRAIAVELHVAGVAEFNGWAFGDDIAGPMHRLNAVLKRTAPMMTDNDPSGSPCPVHGEEEMPTSEEADAELRALGLDPDDVRREGAALANAALREKAKRKGAK